MKKQPDLLGTGRRWIQLFIDIIGILHEAVFEEDMMKPRVIAVKDSMLRNADSPIFIVVEYGPRDKAYQMFPDDVVRGDDVFIVNLDKFVLFLDILRRCLYGTRICGIALISMMRKRGCCSIMPRD